MSHKEVPKELIDAIPRALYRCGCGNGCAYTCDGQYINDEPCAYPPDQLFWSPDDGSFLCDDCFRFNMAKMESKGISLKVVIAAGLDRIVFPGIYSHETE